MVGLTLSVDQENLALIYLATIQALCVSIIILIYIVHFKQYNNIHNYWLTYYKYKITYLTDYANFCEFVFLLNQKLDF